MLASSQLTADESGSVNGPEVPFASVILNTSCSPAPGDGDRMGYGSEDRFGTAIPFNGGEPIPVV